MATVGSLVVNLMGNTQNFRKEFSAVPGMLRSVAASAMSLIGIGGGLAGLGRGISLAASAEQTSVAFETMLGSAEQAKSMLSDLRSYSDKSPFSFVGVADSARLLLNMGVTGDQVMETMRMLGDIAAGDEQKLHGLALAFGQSSSAGRLMGQDLNQMINAGFNPLQEISKRTGESMADLKSRMEAGGISTSEVTQAFRDATSEGGRFYGMTDRMSGTLLGRFSTLRDGVDTALREIGQSLVTNLNLSGVLDHVSEFVGLIPVVVRNGGDLLKAGLIDWQLAFMDFTPGAESAMAEVGAYINATWVATQAGFSAFITNISGGFTELKNLATAVFQAISSGVSAIASGKNPLSAATEAFQQTLASQKDVLGAGDPIKIFDEEFARQLANAREGIQDRGGLSNAMREERDRLQREIDSREAVKLPSLTAPKLTEPLAPNDSGSDGNSLSTKRQEEPLTAVMKGSKEAQQSILRAMSRGATDPSKTQEELAKKNNKALDLANSYLKKIADFQAGGSAETVVDIKGV